MKKCPYCAEEIQDKELQCWNCGEWFDIVSPPQQGTVVNPPKKEQSGTDSIDGKTKLRKICNKHRAPIIGIIIIIAIILLTISQTPNLNKSAEQVTAIDPPKVESPAAPEPKPAPAPEPASAPKPAPASEPAPAPKPVLASESALAPESAPSPDSAINLFNNAVSLCSSGTCTDPQKAIEYLTEAIHIQPDFANAYGFRGNVYIDLKQYPLAIQDYDEAIRLKPDEPVFFNNRGNTYFSQGNNELGCRDVQKACELGNCRLLEDFKGKGLCR